MTTTFDTDLTRPLTEHEGPTLATPPGKLAEAHLSRTRSGIGLGGRIFLLAATLLVVTLGLTVVVVAWRSARVAEDTIRDDLARVPEVWAGYASTTSDSALEQVRSLAMEAGTMAIFADEVDLSTRLSFAVEDAPEILTDGGTFFLFDRSSRVLARSDRPDGDGVGQLFGGVGWVASVLDSWQGTTAFIREHDNLAVVAAAPVIAGEGDGAQLQGVFAVTFPLDDDALNQLQTLTRGEVAIVLDMARRGESPELRLSRATPGIDGDAWIDAVFAQENAVEHLIRDGQTVGPATVALENDQRVCLALPIANSTGEVFSSLLVMRSRDEEMAGFYASRRVLIIAGTAMLLLSLPISFLLGRSIARPLRQLADGAEAIRDGRLDVVLPAPGGGEIGVLTEAFAAMVEDLKEKNALEELLADLRARAHDTDTAGDTVAADATEPSSTFTGAGKVPKSGELFGNRYQIRSELGRGGMGVVYRASDLELEEDVALKILRPGAFENATDGLAKLKREIRLARRISHPNVIRVHDLVEAGGLRSLSMEYVPGTTLLKVLKDHGALSLAPGLQVAKQLCRGLAAVHSEGIVHRDLKPQNIMVLPNGVVKLMDFGISRGTHTTIDGERVAVEGTPAYMSPEQCQGRELTHVSDIYSLGMMLWEMFAGAMPFRGSSVGEIIHKQLTEAPRPLTEVRNDVPPELSSVVMSCLEKKMDRRPQSANLVYQQLREILVVEW